MKLKTFLRSCAAALGAVLLVVGGIVVLSPAPAHAETFKFNVTVNQAQAFTTTCPSGTAGTGAGTGTASVTYDTATNVLSWTITFSGISPTAAHFHGPALPGVEAGVQVTIGDVTSPSVGNTSLMPLTEGQEGQLLSSMWYINYHTAACPGGEIRGQVSGVGVGGVAGAPEVERSPLAAEEKGAGTGLIAAIAAGTTAAVALAGGATLAWRRRAR